MPNASTWRRRTNITKKYAFMDFFGSEMFPKCDTMALGLLCRITGSLLLDLGEGGLFLLLLLAGDAIAPKTIQVHILRS